MSHKIESGNNSLVVSGPRATSRSSANGNPASITTTVPTDSLKVTDQGRLAARIVQTARELPAADGQRVANTRKALDSGQYSVNASAIAGRLLKMEWQLANL